MAKAKTSSVEVTVARVEQKLDSTIEKLDKHIEVTTITQQRILDGINGYGDTPGLQARIHTLEDRADAARWGFREISTSIVSAILAAGAITWWPK